MLHIVSIIVLYSGLPRDNIGICARKIVEYHLDNGNQMANIDIGKYQKSQKCLCRKRKILFQGESLEQCHRTRVIVCASGLQNICLSDWLYKPNASILGHLQIVKHLEVKHPRGQCLFNNGNFNSINKNNDNSRKVGKQNGIEAISGSLRKDTLFCEQAFIKLPTCEQN